MGFKRKYFFNEDFFEKIDNERKAYWLGFIYADGCVGKRGDSLIITLCKEDKEHLRKLALDIQYEGEIKHKFSKSNFSEELYESVRIELNSAKMCRDLGDKGVHFDKTLNCNFPSEEIVSKDLIHHFVRGFMDGDGSISRFKQDSEYSPYDYSLKFIGTLEMMEGIKNFFKKEVKLLKDNRCNIPIYSLSYHGNNITYDFLNILYKDATIFLDRKYERYCDLVNCIEYNYFAKLEKEYGEYSLVLSELEKGKRPSVIIRDNNLVMQNVYKITQPFENIRKNKIDKYLIENKDKKSKSELSRETGRSRDYIRALYKRL